jgi:hypothetical protein
VGEIAHGAVTRRPAISLYAMVPRAGSYAYGVGVWDLSVVQGPPSLSRRAAAAVAQAKLDAYADLGEPSTQGDDAEAELGLRRAGRHAHASSPVPNPNRGLVGKWSWSSFRVHSFFGPFIPFGLSIPFAQCDGRTSCTKRWRRSDEAADARVLSCRGSAACMG